MIRKAIAIKLLFLVVISVPSFIFAQQPNVMYNSPVVYNVGTPIPPLAPTNIGLPATGSLADSFVSTFGVNDNFSNPGGLAIDDSGNIYLADAGNNRIVQITPAGVVSTFAGSGTAGATDGKGIAASFNNPVWVAIDHTTTTLYVADAGSYLIRKITADGVVTTMAGSGKPGYVDGIGSAASFTSPSFIAVDITGNVYVNANDKSGVIRKVTPNGTVSTFVSGLTAPAGMTIDNLGNVYVVCNGPGAFTFHINMISPAGSVTDLYSYQDLGLGFSSGITMDSAGNFYIANANTTPSYNYIIYVDAKSHYSLIYLAGRAGDVNGGSKVARFTQPTGIVIDRTDNIFVSDKGPYQLREISHPAYVSESTLPAGLTLDNNTGITSGTPTTIAPPANYRIFSYNPYGGDTVTINIEIKQPVVFTFAPIPAKTVCDTDFYLNATTNTGSLFTSSSNTAVATTIGAKVHIVGPGTSIITVNNLGSTLSQTLTVKSPPTIAFYGDVVNEGKGVQLNPVISGNVIAYKWTPSIGLSNPSIANPIANPTNTITYHLTLTSADGCTAGSDSVLVRVLKNIIIPNTFTPNGDGINDLWDISLLSDYTACVLNVYNRYGSLVYHSIGYGKPWDGTNGGKQLPAGTYFYVIDLKNEKPQLAGSVTILR